MMPYALLSQWGILLRHTRAYIRTMKKAQRSVFLFLALLLFALWPISGTAQGNTQVVVLTMDMPITHVSANYLERGLRIAQAQDAEALVIMLNTPGGTIGAMNEMVRAIRNSEVPVIVYVAPRGAMAGSAGTLITLAGHLSAMAPETAIGAAASVGPGGEDLGETLRHKIDEMTRATARSLAERRGPQAVQLADESITKARAVSASEALAANLVDFIAEDLDELLRLSDGESVTLPDGRHTLHTRNAVPIDLPPTLIESVLLLLTDPNVLFLLLVLGMQAILLEISHPGGWVAGFVGIISLLLAGYGMGLISVNWLGIFIILLAFVLFILDVKAHTHGALTTAGILTFISGSLVLFNSQSTLPFLHVSTPLVVTTGIFFGIVSGFLVRLGWQAMQQKPRMGRETLVGRIGTVKVALTPKGQVQVAGELWSAEVTPKDAAPVTAGTRVRVVAVNGLRVTVETATE